MRKEKISGNKSVINREAFGLRLRQLRREKGLTQSELASILEVSRSGVANWEKGERFPESHYINKMAVIFGVPVDYLYGLTSHRYNINVPDYFELDLTKLNSLGIQVLHVCYKLLLNSKEYCN